MCLLYDRSCGRNSCQAGQALGAGPGEAGAALGTCGARPEQTLTRCLVFCKLFLRILRISSSLSLESAGRMRSAGRDLGWMFLEQHSTAEILREMPVILEPAGLGHREVTLGMAWVGGPGLRVALQLSRQPQ